MLNFKIVNTNGSVKKLEKILTASLDSETDIPADSLVITCPFDSGISKNADRIMAFDEDKLVFKGQIDEKSISLMRKCDFTSLTPLKVNEKERASRTIGFRLEKKSDKESSD